MNVQEELIRRYNYLLDNKELILANCIIYGIEKEYLKKTIKQQKNIIKQLKKDITSPGVAPLIELAEKGIVSYEKKLKTPKAYLTSKPSKKYAEIIEEFILGDKNIEETKLYCYIESIKDNPKELLKYKTMINDLEERRNSSENLRKIPTFTVWKILSLIRDKYERNEVVLKALDKYYNLERYNIAKDDSEYGYYIPNNIEEYPQNYPSTNIYIPFHDGTGVSYMHRRNKFEKEDDYFAIDYNADELRENYYPTIFANELKNSEMISNKKELFKEIIKAKQKVIV